MAINNKRYKNQPCENHLERKSYTQPKNIFMFYCESTYYYIFIDSRTLLTNYPSDRNLIS